MILKKRNRKSVIYGQIVGSIFLISEDDARNRFMASQIAGSKANFYCRSKEMEGLQDMIFF